MGAAHEGVVASAAVDLVGVHAAAQPVVAVLAVEGVDAFVAPQRVVVIAAVEEVALEAAVEHILAVVASERVEPAAAFHRVVAAETAEGIVEFGQVHLVGAVHHVADDVEVIPDLGGVAGVEEQRHVHVPAGPVPTFDPVATVDQIGGVRHPEPLTEALDRPEIHVGVPVFERGPVEGQRVAAFVEEIAVLEPEFVGVVAELVEIRIGVPIVQIVRVKVGLVGSVKDCHLSPVNFLLFAVTARPRHDRFSVRMVRYNTNRIACFPGYILQLSLQTQVRRQVVAAWTGDRVVIAHSLTGSAGQRVRMQRGPDQAGLGADVQSLRLKALGAARRGEGGGPAANRAGPGRSGRTGAGVPASVRGQRPASVAMMLRIRAASSGRDSDGAWPHSG